MVLRLIFDKYNATRVFHHASIQDPPNADDEIQLEKQFLHLSTHVDLDDNNTSYGDPIYIFDGSTSHHRKWMTTSVEHKIEKENG